MLEEEVGILTVDDAQENLIALRALLQQPGLRTIEARSGEEALEHLLVEDIGLALIDVNMPAMDGFELAELMRGAERTKHIPIIFLTASLPEGERIFRGYEAGAVDFLFKPIDPNLLLSKVEVFAQLHRQRLMLRRQLEQLREAQETSDLFIGVLGHDLRTPLASIVSSTAALELRPGDAEVTLRCAQLIKRSAMRMNRLTQQVLDFALARVKGGVPLEPAETDLSNVVRHLTAEIEHPARDRVQLQLSGDTVGHWDADRLGQVISNLLTNAVEHGSQDSIVSLTVDGTDAEQVVIEIRNRGVISQETLDVLFDPFKPRERRGSGGLGLGLYIVDQIVRSHGGAVSAQSDATLGTRLRVTLPRRTDARSRCET